ncbi:MFS transporter [Ameyamaea chiangmaiensis]|uniref:MFS transporter n=2 Tax=Ameyamaea chiangmaiensis TaxID=442969 RepID=A0A850PEJ2_9PROT|nr:MFS transporter [Ameyamaea chiangmaiensis]NVN41099.1 MFS transporter [Ameyamaea chiangmaiensis]
MSQSAPTAGRSPPNADVTVGVARMTLSMRRTALILASAMFMEQLDGTVLATALPSMAHSFGVDPLHTSIALTAYMVALAVFIPASGPVADRFGSRTTLMAAILIFLGGSVLCAQADSLSALTFARVLQGMGGAMMVPVGRLVLLRTVPKPLMITAMAWMITPASIAPLVGPLVGGALTTWLSWRWIFYVNVPVAVVGLLMTWWFIPQIRESRPVPFDVRGQCLFGIGLGSFVLLLELAGRGDTQGRTLLELLGLCLGCMVLYARHATVTAAPAVDLSLMRIATFRISFLAGGFSRVTVGAMPFLVPSFLQLGFHISAFQSGLVTFAAPVGAMVTRSGARRLFHRFGFRRVLIVNGVLTGAACLAITAFRPGWPPASLSGLLLLMGGLQALQFMGYNTIAYADVPQARMSAATSLYSTLQQTTLSLGVCLAAATLAITRALRHHASSTPGDFSVGFLVAGLVALLAAPTAALLSPRAGAELSGHAARTQREQPTSDSH